MVSDQSQLTPDHSKWKVSTLTLARGRRHGRFRSGSFRSSPSLTELRECKCQSPPKLSTEVELGLTNRYRALLARQHHHPRIKRKTHWNGQQDFPKHMSRLCYSITICIPRCLVQAKLSQKPRNRHFACVYTQLTVCVCVDIELLYEYTNI